MFASPTFTLATHVFRDLWPYSGRGCSLSRLQYERVTRPKSFHLRTAT